ncbi:MAG: neutral/alkaline non-lysosomal ceramidase N-terminal domain-containing protein [Limisphaerales bacterium]
MRNKRLRSLLVPLLIGVARLSGQAAPAFEAGEGVVDISPPVGTALGGYRYRDPAKPRVSTGLATPPEARALVLRRDKTTAVILSLDMLNISFDMVRRVQAGVEKTLGIPATHVHITATHSHTMPSIAFNRHWGDQNPAYEAAVEAALEQAVRKGIADLAATTLRVGSAVVVGGNRNRTLKGEEAAKTQAEFTNDSTDADRWLDTRLRLLAFERTGRPTLAWYNFSAHPTAMGGSTLAGAEWPGLVQKILREERKLSPSFLQGHIGDVAPLKPDATARAVADAIGQALDTAQPVAVDTLRIETQPFALPLDLAVFKARVAAKRPLAAEGRLDAYEKDWYENFAARYDLTKAHLPITLGAIRIGPVGLLFHPAELYSCYGLAIQRDSPLPHTFVIGYADGYVGYVADPKAYTRSEYAAVMVPTILNYPPFTPNAGREMAAAAAELLRRVAR